jgi:hypothetical protein
LSTILTSYQPNQRPIFSTLQQHLSFSHFDPPLKSQFIFTFKVIIASQECNFVLVICSNPYIYTTVVQEMNNRDRSPEVDNVEGLAAAATKHLDLLKQKDEEE